MEIIVDFDFIMSFYQDFNHFLYYQNNSNNLFLWSFEETILKDMEFGDLEFIKLFYQILNHF
jgi:hypothetical protein